MKDKQYKYSNSGNNKCVGENNLCYKCEKGNRCKKACLAITECEQYIEEGKYFNSGLNYKRTSAWLRGKDVSGDIWWN